MPPRWTPRRCVRGEEGYSRPRDGGADRQARACSDLSGRLCRWRARFTSQQVGHHIAEPVEHLLARLLAWAWREEQANQQAIHKKLEGGPGRSQHRLLQSLTVLPVPRRPQARDAQSASRQVSTHEACRVPCDRPRGPHAVRQVNDVSGASRSRDPGPAALSGMRLGVEALLRRLELQGVDWAGVERVATLIQVIG